MRKSLKNILGSSLLVIAAATATAGDRPKIKAVQELKTNQCAAASYVYEQGELVQMSEGITQVCTTINGRSVWLLVDEQEFKRMSKS